MTSNFRRCLAQVLKYEGGFVNHPRDPGGATNKGVTLATFRRFYPGASVADLRNMTQAQLEKIYYRGYWLPIDGEGLGPGVDLAVFDLAVNSGVGRAKKMFRQVMHLHRRRDIELVGELCDNRMRFLRNLKHWSTFGRGWTARVSHVRQLGMKWAGAKFLPEPPVPQDDIDKGANRKGMSLVDRFFEWLTNLVRGIFR